MALVNTGEKEKRQLDINPNSPTYGTFQWVSAGTDTIACPLPAQPVYASQAISQIVFRDDCGIGKEGGPVLYSMPAGAKVSYVSQADANTLAQTEFDNTKQAYANAHGTCSNTQSQSGGGNNN
jgi:hypothetical protein